MNDFQLKLQAMLDKVKTLANIKKDIREIQSKIPPVKLTGELNESKTTASINKSTKKIKPKITIDADTSKLDKTLEKTLKKKRSIKISPSIDSTEFSKTSKEVEKQSQTLFSKLSNNIAGLDITRRVLQEFVNSVKNAISNVKELNKIATDVQMASGATKSETNGLMSSYHSLAKEISSTTKATADNANTFIRMGESLRDTNTLIKNSQMLSKIGMIENADSADYLISMMKGYQVAAQDSISITDKLTSVDMSAAISAGGLAQAMSRVSNIANSSGTSMDRLIGYIATVGEVTQKSMSEVGNSFQSIYSRMNNIKIGKFIDDESGEDLSDTEAVLGKIGIKLRENETTYRDFDDVLDDVGKNWTKFNKVEQNSIAVAIAGTRQRENFTALMNNYGSALEYAGIAANSAGTALKRYEVYQDSLEAKTNQLTNAFEGLSVNLIDDDTYAGILDATAALVEFIDKTNLLKGTLAGVATAGILSAFSSIATGAVAAAKSAAHLTSVMAMFNNGKSNQILEEIGIACKGLSDKQLKLVLSTKGLKNAQREIILTGMDLNETQIAEKLSALGFANAENVATGATFSFAGALNTLKTAFATNPIGMSIMAITTAVSVGTMAFSYYKQKQEEALRVAQDAANTYADTSKSIKDYTERYEELHQALIDARGNEEATYNVKKQLLDLQIELNDKYGDEYGKVNLVTDAYRDQTEAIKALNKEAANKVLNDIGEAEINAITERMTTPQIYTLSDQYIISDSARGKALQELAQKYSDQGIKISDTSIDGLQDTFMITIEASPKDAYETIGAFMSDVRNKANELDDEHIFDGILEISKSSYDGTAKDIEDLGKAYNEILRAQISRDDNLSAQYNNAIQAVKDYNEAVLKSEDPINDGSVKDAYTNLKELESGIQSNETEWGKYSSIMNEVFDQADTRMMDFTNKLSSTDYSNLLDGLRHKSDVDAKALINTNEGDAYKELISLADEYSMSIDDVISGLQKMGIVAETTTQTTAELPKAFSKSEMIATINATTDGFEVLDKIMSSMKDKNPFNYALLDDKNFKDTFGELGESYENFVEKISNSPKDVKGCQGVYDDLLTTWLNSTDIISGLSDKTAQLTIDMLSNMGVANAETIITEVLAQRHAELSAEKYYNANASEALKNNTLDEYVAFLNEADGADVSKQALAQLELTKIAVNNAQIDTSSDIDQVINLANAAGAGVQALGKLARAKAVFAQAESGSLDLNVPGNNLLLAEAENTVKEIGNGGFDYEFKIDANQFKSATYGGGAKTNKPSSGSKSKDTSEEINYIDRLLSESDKRLKWYKNALEDAFTIDEKDSAITKMVTETEYQLKQMNDVYTYYSKAASEKLSQIPEGMREAVKDGTIDIEKLNDKNLANLIKEFWELDGQADDAQDKIRDLNKSIHDLAQQKIQIRIDFLEDKNDNLNKRLDKYKSLISAVVSSIEGEIDDVNAHYDRQIDRIQAQIDGLESQKKAIQDQLDLLEQQNKALDIQKAKEDAIYARRKAENNKNVHIYREDKGDGTPGMVWESDQDAVKDAKEQEDEAIFNEKKYNLQTQIDAFDKQISALDETIDKFEKTRDNEIDYLNSIKDSWNSIEETAERIANMEMASNYWGDSWFGDIMDGDTSYLDDMTEKFQTTYGIISDNQQVIDSLTGLKDNLAFVDGETALKTANMAANFNTLGSTVTTVSGDINTATSAIPVYTEENRALNEEPMLLWGEQFTTFGGQACSVADSIAVSYEMMAARLEAAAERAVAAIKRIKRAERDDDDDDGYAKGTRNAKPGLHPVAEGNKPEIIIKNNGAAVIADKETYYPFSGGETVLNPQDTKDILSGGDDTSPWRQFTDLDMKYLSNINPNEIMANYLPNLKLPRYDESKVVINRTENQGPSLTIGKIEMHEVNDAEGLTKEICSTYQSRMGQMLSRR